MDVTKHGNSILTDGESTLAVGRGVTGGGARVSQGLPAAGQDRDSALRFCDKNLLKQSRSQCPQEAPGITGALAVHTTFSQVHLGVPSLPRARGLGDPASPADRSRGADAPAPVPGPTPHISGTGGAAGHVWVPLCCLGPPSTCCSGDCPYPALLCAPELPQVDGTTQEAPLSRTPVGLSQWRPEGGRS